eukprot:2267587-Rhodomonas_salina.3
MSPISTRLDAPHPPSVLRSVRVSLGKRFFSSFCVSWSKGSQSSQVHSIGWPEVGYLRSIDRRPRCSSSRLLLSSTSDEHWGRTSIMAASW